MNERIDSSKHDLGQRGKHLRKKGNHETRSIKKGGIKLHEDGRHQKILDQKTSNDRNKNGFF